MFGWCLKAGKQNACLKYVFVALGGDGALFSSSCGLSLSVEASGAFQSLWTWGQLAWLSWCPKRLAHTDADLEETHFQLSYLHTHKGLTGSLRFWAVSATSHDALQGLDTRWSMKWKGKKETERDRGQMSSGYDVAPVSPNQILRIIFIFFLLFWQWKQENYHMHTPFIELSFFFVWEFYVILYFFIYLFFYIYPT